METILCCPVARINLVLGKFLTVFTVSIATVIAVIVEYMRNVREWRRRFCAHSMSRQAGIEPCHD